MPGRRHETLAFLNQRASASELTTAGTRTQPPEWPAEGPSKVAVHTVPMAKRGHFFPTILILFIRTQNHKVTHCFMGYVFVWMIPTLFNGITEPKRWAVDPCEATLSHYDFPFVTGKQLCQLTVPLAVRHHSQPLSQRGKTEQAKRSCIPLKTKLQVTLNQNHSSPSHGEKTEWRKT